MTIKVGEKIPSVLLKQLTAEGMQDLSTDSVFGGGKVVMFGVPGAYTPTCSTKHLPSFVRALDQFTGQGITVACLSVNDPFVMKSWCAEGKAEGLVFLPDGNATFTKALGMDMDGSAYGLGVRAQRFALYAEDGVVKYVATEKPGAYEVSSAEAVLKVIKELKA